MKGAAALLLCANCPCLLPSSGNQNFHSCRRPALPPTTPCTLLWIDVLKPTVSKTTIQNIVNEHCNRPGKSWWLQSWIISDITDPTCQFNNLQVDLTGDAVLASQYARWSPCQTRIVWNAPGRISLTLGPNRLNSLSAICIQGGIDGNAHLLLVLCQMGYGSDKHSIPR